ncbi:MAG: substrate-binding domain-containing protein [Nitrospiria bacterium]
MEYRKNDARFVGTQCHPICCKQAGIGTATAETIRIDGSNTVYPISEAVAKELGRVNRKDRVTIGVSGTGGGFKKFCNGETDINDGLRAEKDLKTHCQRQDHAMDSCPSQLPGQNHHPS